MDGSVGLPLGEVRGAGKDEEGVVEDGGGVETVEVGDGADEIAGGEKAADGIGAVVLKLMALEVNSAHSVPLWAAPGAGVLLASEEDRLQ